MIRHLSIRVRKTLKADQQPWYKFSVNREMIESLSLMFDDIRTNKHKNQIACFKHSKSYSHH